MLLTRAALMLALATPAAALAEPAAAPAAPAVASTDDKAANPVEKPIRTLISAVRFKKDDMALKFVAGEAMGKALLGDTWNTATPAQRDEFVSLFQTLFAKSAFPKMREKFEHLQTIVYDTPEIAGDTARIRSTIVILHAMKRQELKLRYSLVKAGADWKIVDVEVLGDSMLGGIREDQIIPIVKQDGIDGLLKLMREKAKA